MNKAATKINTLSDLQGHISMSRVGFSRYDAVKFGMALMGFFLGRATLFNLLTPLCIAYLSAMFGSGYIFYVSAGCVLVGVLTKFGIGSVFFLRYLVIIALLCGLNFFVSTYVSKHKNVYIKSPAQGLAGAFACIAGGLAVAYFDKVNNLLMFVTTLEGAITFCLTFVLKRGVNAFTSPKRNVVLTNEDMISLAILCGGIITGAADIFLGVVSLRFTLCAYLILLMAYKAGPSIGGIAGMLSGFLLYMAGYEDVSLAVIFAICGLAAGTIKKGKQYDKPLEILIFVLAATCSAYVVNKGLIRIELLYSIAVSAALFMITPAGFNFHISSFVFPASDNNEEYIQLIKTVVSDKLLAFAKAFDKLSTTFESLTVPKQERAKNDVSLLIDEISENCCHDCTRRETCWDDEFFNTYRIMYELLDKAEKNGQINNDDLPTGLGCINPKHFIFMLSKQYDRYKLNINWNNRIAESRALISQQLMGISGIMRNLATEVNVSMHFSEDLEEQLLSEFIKQHMEVERVIVLENKSGLYEVLVTHRDNSNPRFWDKPVQNILYGVLKRTMQKDETVFHRNLFCTRYVEEKKLRVISGVANQSKGLRTECGDSYSSMELKNGKCLLCLSDGMGTGSRARRESTATVELLEEFLESGFENEIAVKIINSVLVLKSNSESFSTLDICSINLYTGDTEFIKIGASSTYLVRDNRVSVIRSSSLPMGMLKDVDLEVSKKKLERGDAVIMATDGLIDSIPTYSEKEAWIEDTLLSAKYSNPQDIADYILSEAKKKADGMIKDDITVLVAKIF